MDEVLEAAAAPAPPPPLLADRYQLLEVIGRGGMAEVYRAADLKLDRTVAVKMLLEGAGDQSDRERFVAEAKTLAMLSHPGLVTVLDAGFGVSGQRRAILGAVELDQPFLVMELVDGPTLATRMKQGPLSPEELHDIALHIADALSYVHARGIVHRDVKPANVLVGDREQVKLADFGIARLVEQRTRYTGTGMAIGTAAYVAPEQVSGGDVDGAADVYALGLVLLEALTGRREYDGAPAEAALARLTRAPAVPALPMWNGLLTAMTALDPAERPSAAEVASALRAGSDALPVPTEAEAVPEAVSEAAAQAASPVVTTAAYDVPSAEGFDPPDPLTTTARRPAVGRGGPGSTLTGPPVDELPEPAKSPFDRLRRPTTDTIVLAGVVAAFLLLFIVTAVVRAGDPESSIPANTPAQIREPLVELHDAVGEDEAEPALAATLDQVDAAIEAGELGEARAAVEDLMEETARARDEGSVGDDQAEEIFAAGGELLAQLPESDGSGTSVDPDGE